MYMVSSKSEFFSSEKQVTILVSILNYLIASKADFPRFIWGYRFIIGDSQMPNGNWSTNDLAAGKENYFQLAGV